MYYIASCVFRVYSTIKQHVVLTQMLICMNAAVNSTSRDGSRRLTPLCCTSSNFNTHASQHETQLQYPEMEAIFHHKHYAGKTQGHKLNSLFIAFRENHVFLGEPNLMIYIASCSEHWSRSSLRVWFPWSEVSKNVMAPSFSNNNN